MTEDQGRKRAPTPLRRSSFVLRHVARRPSQIGSERKEQDSMADTTSYRLALIGFGAVGQGLAQILRYHSDWLAQRYGVALRIVAVYTHSRGSLYDPAGLDPADLLEEIARVGHLRDLPAYSDHDPLDLIERSGADV